jgi:hypothetical protein
MPAASIQARHLCRDGLWRGKRGGGKPEFSENAVKIFRRILIVKT